MLALKTIIAASILLIYSCRTGEILFKKNEANDNCTVLALEDYGPGYHYVSIQKKKHRESCYLFIFECRYGGFGFQGMKDEINNEGSWIAVTDTINGDYFSFGELLFRKADLLSFKPLTEEERQWFLQASEKIKSDSCLHYNISQVIGFVKRVQ